MSRVIDLEEGRLLVAVKRGYRNWEKRFKESFGPETKLSQISSATLSYLAQGKDKGTFYIYDLIMNLQHLGSGFDFSELNPRQKMALIDQYLFVLDRIRFECMKRLGWLKSYPGEDIPLAQLIGSYNKIAPSLQAEIPVLDQSHICHEEYEGMNTNDKEAFIRKLIPKALEEFQNYSTTL